MKIRLMLLLGVSLSIVSGPATAAGPPWTEDLVPANLATAQDIDQARIEYVDYLASVPDPVCAPLTATPIVVPKPQLTVDNNTFGAHVVAAAGGTCGRPINVQPLPPPPPIPGVPPDYGHDIVILLQCYCPVSGAYGWRDRDSSKNPLSSIGGQSVNVNATVFPVAANHPDIHRLWRVKAVAYAPTSPTPRTAWTIYSPSFPLDEPEVP